MRKDKPKQMPVVPLRGLVVFPYMVLHFDVGRETSIKAVKQAMQHDSLVFVVTQIDEGINLPTMEDVYDIGTIAKIKQILKLPGEKVRVLVEGVSRAVLTNFVQTKPYTIGTIEEFLPENIIPDTKYQALIKGVQDTFTNYFQLSTKFTPDIISQIMSIIEPGQFADVIAANSPLGVQDKQAILDCINVQERLNQLLYTLTKEIDMLGLERDVLAKTRDRIDKNQKEYFLREQLKVIQSELGESEGFGGEIAAYRAKMESITFPQEVADKLETELGRLSKMSYGTPESTVIRSYVETILDLPWGQYTADNIDLDLAQKILNRDHYGLEKVKERVLEYLSSRMLNHSMQGPILCLVGPPGVGKTSIAKSIAQALGKNYVRISLGGMRDEADIRGHRKTYIGAMPGRIISALKQAGSSNPLMLFDEIDKMASDFRGDPGAAMLEVFDSEQNFAFRDHFLEVPFDLSKILFIVTANSLETVSRPLLDRMEIIEVGSYIADEKYHIAKRYLLPKQLKKHGLSPKNLRIDETALYDIIKYYTRESGVRNLEREIGTLCRKAAKLVASGDRKSISVNTKNLESFLGAYKYTVDPASKKDIVGVATGLAWTSVGGDTLSIEVNIMDGSGRIELTGRLGDVMKESAQAAISFARANAQTYRIDPDFYKKKDIHIHVPEGATPKDGPSAGITIATALISALSGTPVRWNVAMTGEITLRGRVLPIGGLKEKALAALEKGITNIIIPHENQKNTADIPKHLRDQIRFIPVSTMQQVLKTALALPPGHKQFEPAANLITGEYLPIVDVTNTGSIAMPK